jgi:hypothetical protein
MRSFLMTCALALLAPTAFAKLPPPSDEAKAKAAEAAAKTAHGNKVADYQLCKAMDRVAAGYHAESKKAGRETKPPVATPACVDPGPFVYPPPAAAASGVATAAAAKPAAPAPAGAAAKK